MVFKVTGIPFKRVLPLGQGLHQLFGLQLGLEPLDKYLIDLHMLKIEYHIKLSASAVAKSLCTRYVNKDGFSHGKRAVRLKHLAPQGLQYPVTALGGKIVLPARKHKLLLTVGKCILVNNIDHVATEAHNTSVEPEAHNVLDLLKHVGIAPIKVGLLFGEKVEIIFVLAIPKPRPRTLGKKVAPVIWYLAVLSLLDYVIIAVFFLTRKRSLEPLMLVGRMVDDKIHNDADASLFCLGYKLVKVRHRAKLRLNGLVI